MNVTTNVLRCEPPHRLFGAVVCAVMLAALLLAPQSYAVQPCANAGNCAQVGMGGPQNAGPGASVSMPFTFTQGPGGALSQLAAIAFTVMIPNGVNVPLTLSDCTPSAADNSLPNAAQPDASLAGFKLVIENAYCSAARTHCLCPDAGSGIVPDNFINVVIYGPNPLPTPGPAAIVIPPLPSGQLFTIGLNVGATVGGSVPLHIMNQVTDSPSTRPAFTALLSVGDTSAVDETCGTAVPPCNDPNGTSQVAITDGEVVVPNGCTGNCDYSDQVTVDEIVTLVNLALNGGTAGCVAGDANNDGTITVDEVVSAVNFALNGCPPPV